MSKLKDGEPCGKHAGCLNHVSHPCEGCGRINGKSVMPELKNVEIYSVSLVEEGGYPFKKVKSNVVNKIKKAKCCEDCKFFDASYFSGVMERTGKCKKHDKALDITSICKEHKPHEKDAFYVD